jgi:hypothetical protein
MSKINLTSSFNQNILDDLEKYNLIQDRLAGDILELPYNFYDIKIKVNDFVVSDTINYSLEKLYTNSLYILSKSVIPSNNIPETRHYQYIANDVGDGANITWKPFSQFNNTSNNCKQQSLSGIKRLLKVKNIENINNYNLVATTNTNVILLSGTGVSTLRKIVNPDLPGIISDSNITHPSNGVTFQQIEDITISESNNLYVLDSTLKTVFKFDISGILTLDDAILKNDTPGRLMTGMVGGNGGLTDKTRFNRPRAITSVNDYVYVIDYDESTDTSAIKVYDAQLNWKQTQSVGKQLSAGPIDCKYNPGTRELFVLCHLPSVNQSLGNNASLTNEQQMPQLVRFDIDTMLHVKTHNFFDVTKHNSDIGTEIFKSMNFSLENPNIMYILSNRNMYKKYVSRPEVFVGTFLVEEKSIGTGDSTNMNFQDFTLVDETLTVYDESTGTSFEEIKDEIYMYDAEYETIHKFLEESNYEKSLQPDIETNFINFNDIQINPEELVSTIVYNKAIMKLLYNNVLILENISRRFTTIFDSRGISKYIGFTYLIESELKKLTYKQTLNNLIGTNEPVLTTTINRCLSELYKLQEEIVLLVQEKSINTYPLITVPVNLT